jgi:hypothetical protein
MMGGVALVAVLVFFVWSLWNGARTLPFWCFSVSVMGTVLYNASTRVGWLDGGNKLGPTGYPLDSIPTHGG